MDAAEAALVQGLKAGDEAVFRRIVEQYKRAVYGLAFRLVRRHESADDLSQEAFLRLWQAREDFDPNYPIFPFLRKIVVNLTYNHLERERYRRTVPLGTEEDDGGPGVEPASNGPTPEVSADLADQKSRVLAALGALGEDKRAALTLRVFEGMSYAEIASALGCSIGTVMSRIFRAREELRERLSTQYS